MTQPSPTSSLEQEEHAASGPRASRSSRVSRSLSAMGFFQQNEDSSESTLSSAGRRDSASRDTLDPAAYGAFLSLLGKCHPTRGRGSSKFRGQGFPRVESHRLGIRAPGGLSLGKC